MPQGSTVALVSDTSDAPLVGRVVGGRFRVVGPLGEGGLAIVYRAEHVELRRPVALKVLHGSFEEHAEARARFVREAQALAALSHPHVVSLIDFGFEADSPYLVMELLEGESLDVTLAREGSLDVARAVSFTRQTLRALAYAHSRGLLHRDIKPGNVFLQSIQGETHIKVLDFGLAKFVERESRGGALTRMGQIAGTPAYMAPEQAGAGEVDRRADLYATAVVLFEMLTGECPFEGKSAQVLRAKLTTEAPSARSLRPDLPPELDAFLARALARDPAQRFRDATRMLEALDAVPVSGGRATVPAAVVASGDRPRSLSALWVAALALPIVPVLFCVAGITTAFLIRGASGADAEPLAAASHAPAEPIAEAAPAGEAAAADEATGAGDPWASGDLPAILWDVQSRVEAGEDIDDATHTSLLRYSHREPRDARAQVLLGHVYAARLWRSDALSRYEAAARIDREVRHDPRMLANLVDLVGHRRAGERAARAIEDIYGAEALPAIDRALASDATGSTHAARLRALRGRLDRNQGL